MVSIQFYKLFILEAVVSITRGKVKELIFVIHIDVRFVEALAGA